MNFDQLQPIFRTNCSNWIIWSSAICSLQAKFVRSTYLNGPSASFSLKSIFVELICLLVERTFFLSIELSIDESRAVSAWVLESCILVVCRWCD